MAKKPEFAPGFEPTPDADVSDLEDPTVQAQVAAAPVVAPATTANDLTALVAALVPLIQALQGQVGQERTATILGEMGSKVLSVEKIDVPAFVLANVKGFDSTPHYKVRDEVRYPQMGNREPLIRTRGLDAEKCRELGIEIPA